MTSIVPAATAHQIQMYGVKEFDFVTVKNLDVNHVNNVYMENPSHTNTNKKQQQQSSFRVLDTDHNDFYQIEADVFTNSLETGSINSLPWQEIVDNVNVKEIKMIEGNVYLTKPSHVKNFFTAAVNNITIKDLLTKTTDQTVFSNIAISKFFTPSMTTGTINGINFKENVVLIGQENHIKCELWLTLFSFLSQFSMVLILFYLSFHFFSVFVL